MDSSLILSNILNPPVLFFFMGMIAIFLKSDLDIPQALPKLFSLYLLFAIGFKGGHEIHESGVNGEIAVTLLAAVLLAAIVLIYSFFILKLKLDSYNTAAIAATYGSISAVTFITASSFLEQQTPPVEYGSHMVAARKIDDLKKSGSFVIAFSIFMPVFNSLVGIFLAKVIEMSLGNALLFTVLCADAS